MRLFLFSFASRPQSELAGAVPVEDNNKFDHQEQSQGPVTVNRLTVNGGRALLLFRNWRHNCVQFS